MNYILTASILFYILVVRAFGNGRLRVTSASVVVTVLPFLLNELITYIMLSGYHSSLSGLFTLPIVVTFIVQLAIAFGTFYLLEQEEETFVTWFIIASVGAVVIYVVTPYFVTLILR